MGNRIFKDKADIDCVKVKAFFDHRVDKKLLYRYNYVNYQDHNPELVMVRDREEKALIAGIMDFFSEAKILDIGCGVGRWGDFFLDKDCEYVGVDYSEKLLKIAKDHFKGKENFRFTCASFQNILSRLKEECFSMSYDYIFVNGVFMYINDNDLPLCLNNVNHLLSKDGVIYIKETVGREQRLTLQQVESEELESEYSAIYRSVDEYNDYFHKFYSDYDVMQQGELFKKKIQNRTETMPYYWIMKKHIFS